MDVITPAATCPHCGLALDAQPSISPAASLTAPGAEPAPPPPPPVAVPEAVAEGLPPAALVDLAAAELAPPPPPAPTASVADIDAAFAPVFTIDVPKPAPAADPEPVPEFMPVVTHVDSDDEPAPAPAHVAAATEVAEEPWIAVPPPARAAEAPARVVDTGRGWGIRGANPGRSIPLLPSLPAALPLPLATPQVARRTAKVAMTGITAVVIAGTLAIVARGAVANLGTTTPTIAAPRAIGTLTQVTTPTSQALLNDVQARVRATSTQTVAAVYGTGKTPKLVFVAYSGAVMQTPDQLVAAVNAGATPFTQTPKVSTVGGQAYVCGRVGTASAPSVLCTWTDARGAAFIEDINTTDLAGALAMATAARASSEG